MESAIVDASHMLSLLFLTAVLFSKLPPSVQLKELTQRDLVIGLEGVGFEHVCIIPKLTMCFIGHQSNIPWEWTSFLLRTNESLNCLTLFSYHMSHKVECFEALTEK